MKISTKLLAAAAFFCATAANAGPLNWTFSGVTFDDGATASGSFTYDADTNSVSNWSISTTSGAVFGPFTYDNSGIAFSSSSSDFYFSDTDLFRFLRIQTSTALTDAGGTIGLLTGGVSSYECTNCSPYRTVTGGSFVAQAAAVPEPAAWALIVVGFGLSGAALRRNRASVTFARA